MLRMSCIAQHLRIVGAGQHEGGFRLLRVRRALEQQAGGGDVADRKQALRPLQQRREFIRIDAPDRRGGSAAARAPQARVATTLALDRGLIGRGDFVA